jgi:hypothetical protein
MTDRLTMAGVLMGLAVVAPANGQSLAELARREEARRKAISAPAKVYTNDNIRSGTPAPMAPVPSPTSASPSAPASATSSATAANAPAAAAGPAKAGASPAAEEPKGEAHWKKRIQAERDALSRAQIFAEALQTRINALSADFVARDDPAQRSVIATDRQKALTELDRVKQEIAQHTKGIAAIQDEARRAGVPPGWLR